MVAGAALLATVTLATPSARAELVSFAAEGTIFDVMDAHGILDGSVSLGGPMRAVIIYDSDVADVSASPVIGAYPQPVPPALFRVEVGSYAIEVPTTYTAEIVNEGIFGDGLLFRREASPFSFFGEPGVTLDFVNLGFSDGSGMAFSSDAIPTLPPTLADFDDAQLDVTGCLDTEIGVQSCPTPSALAIRATITSVPEPRADTLAVIVLLLWAARERLAARNESLRAASRSAHRTRGRALVTV